MAKLILSDGTEFEGESFGAEEPCFVSAQQDTVNKAQDDTPQTFGTGEVVFNTGMVGYPESLTDPSYRGQILTFTYPLIGNYGVPTQEMNEWGFSNNLESENIHVRGVICAKVSEDFSHWKAQMSLPEWLKRNGIPGITGIDTRALTKKLREEGVMLGRIVCDDEVASDMLQVASIEDPNERNLVAEVSCTEVHTYEPNPSPNPNPIATIVAIDCGIKRNILRSFLNRGVRIVRVPWNFDITKADFEYDGVFVANGPGDPKMCKETIASIKYAIEKEIPTFGICLGNQLLSLAIGGDTYKLKYGHRGANQPCTEYNADGTKTKRCIITSQNHGFAVKGDNLPKGWHVWWKNENDDTVEGIRHESGKFFSVQFHPEATPGPEDANYLFDEFINVLQK